MALRRRVVVVEVRMGRESKRNIEKPFRFGGELVISPREADANKY